MKKRLGRWYHNSDLSSLFSAVAMESLLTALPFILKSVLIWMTNYVVILLQTPYFSEGGLGACPRGFEKWVLTLDLFSAKLQTPTPKP